MTEKTKTGKPRPKFRVVSADDKSPSSAEESGPNAPELPEPITALVPPQIKSAVDALVRIYLGTGTVADLAEIALTVNEGETKFDRLWFLEAVTTSIQDLQRGMNEAARGSRWNEATALETRQADIFNRMRAVLTRNAKDMPPGPWSGDVS